MREFRSDQGRSGERYWMVDVKGDKVISIWGAIVSGKHKEHGKTEDIPGPKGKPGTKAFVSAADNAQFVHDRAIRKKLEEGYVEVGMDGKPLVGGAISVIDHSEPLPKNLCFSKPKNSVKEGFLRTLDANNDVIYTRKMNGMMVIVHITDAGLVEVYSRRMERLTGYFPHLERALGQTRDGMQLPPRTILLMEAFLGEGNTKRDLLLVQSIMRSDKDVALEKQEKTGWMKFYLFRVPIYGGLEMERAHTNGHLIELLDNTFTDKFIAWRDHPNSPVKGQVLYTLEYFHGTAEEALKEARELGYEGWVGYQKSKSLEDQSYSFNGKPGRPSCVFKLKPSQEDDFIAYWNPKKSTKERPLGTFGSGKNMGKVGTLSLYQRTPDGEEVYICEVGTGLTDKQKQRDLANIKIYPIVVQVEFEERFYKSAGDKSNALQLPRVSGIRTDKKPEECINEELAS